MFNVDIEPQESSNAVNDLSERITKAINSVQGVNSSEQVDDDLVEEDDEKE